MEMRGWILKELAPDGGTKAGDAEAGSAKPEKKAKKRKSKKP